MATKSKDDYIKQLEADILTLVGRLYGEDDNSFAPETLEVMKRWRPIFERLYLKDAEEAEADHIINTYPGY
jgi:hypothetical protein